MLTQYTNISNQQKSISANRLTNLQLQQLTYKIDVDPTINIQDNKSRLEIHFYSGDSWITGNHKIVGLSQISEYRDKTTDQIIRFNGQPIGIDLKQQLESLNLKSGRFRFAINFFRNLIGSYEQQHLVIDEISPDRTELKLRAINPTNIDFLTEITQYINSVNQTSGEYLKTYLLNFSRNQTIQYVNSVVIGEFLYVKLLNPLSNDFELGFKCWVVEQLKNTYLDFININLLQTTSKTYNKLSNPNWQANAIYNTSTDTGLKTWTDLLGSSVQTSQQIVDSYFSGSLSGINLNIDYSDFNNFIYYSSATERIENFKYKLELLEYFTSQSTVISLISGSTATTNMQDYENQRINLISGFDSFEKYLYYESSSKLTTYEIPSADANVLQLTGSYITPVPKTNSTKPYTNVSTNTTQFKNWYAGLYDSASLYDSRNINALIYSVPEYIRFDRSTENLSTFVNMLGHHFDILYMYINHMTKIHKREENPKLGMPNELLYSVAKQFGWNLTNGNQNHDLWQYVLGTNETGIPLTGSNTVGDPSVSGQNSTYTIWRRIVNNLPLLLKSKGTKRSVQALLSCYGIPQSIITIKEYGGPRIDRVPTYEKLNFDYSLDLITNTAGTVTTNYSQSINTIEVRFRTDNVVKSPTMPSTMNLFSVGNNHVTIDFTRGTLGTIQINGTSSADIEIFDGSWITAMLRTSGSDLQVVAKKSKYGKIISAVSASTVATFPYSGSVILGGTSTGASRLQGQLQELRLWSSSLEDTTFNNHVKAPSAYDGNIDAYDELVFRLPLTQKINHSLTSSLNGVQPVSNNISSSFSSWTNATPYDSIEEMYYYDSISIGGSTYDDNKVRIESNELIGNLDIKTRAERSQFDTAPLDSKRLGVYFSPQTMIDEDIIAHLGFTVLDDYIGDPGEVEDKSYPRLIQRAREYWKKYADKNDINAYIKIFTLFDLSFFKQLEQLLPGRTDKITGLLIQPNLLERNKDTILPKISRKDETLNISLSDIPPTASGTYILYTGSVESVLDITSDYNGDTWQMYITASDSSKYDGVQYTHDYIFRSGSTWITGSTPYWLSEPFGPSITGSVDNNDFNPAGLENQRFSGCQMTSPDFNINSEDTIDGKPVVEWKIVNANQLVYTSLTQNNGNFQSS